MAKQKKVTMTELHELNKMVADYMQAKANNPITILEKAAKIYVNHKDELGQKLQLVFFNCMLFIKHDFGKKDITCQEFCELGDELIEDLSGYLGEYFDN